MWRHSKTLDPLNAGILGDAASTLFAVDAVFDALDCDIYVFALNWFNYAI